MSAMQRNKGAAAERQIAILLQQHGWPKARRTSDGRAQAERGDIAHGPAGVHIEIKRQERVNVPAAMRQAIDDANGLDVPLVHRPSRMPWMVTMELEELLPLLALRERG